MPTRNLIAAGALAVAALFSAAATAADVADKGAELGKWTSDAPAAQELSKTSGKPLFIQFTGSDWCGWCKLMDGKVFSTRRLPPRQGAEPGPQGAERKARRAIRHRRLPHLRHPRPRRHAARPARRRQRHHRPGLHRPGQGRPPRPRHRETPLRRRPRRLQGRPGRARRPREKGRGLAGQAPKGSPGLPDHLRRRPGQARRPQGQSPRRRPGQVSPPPASLKRPRPPPGPFHPRPAGAFGIILAWNGTAGAPSASR